MNGIPLLILCTGFCLIFSPFVCNQHQLFVHSFRLFANDRYHWFQMTIGCTIFGGCFLFMRCFTKICAHQIIPNVCNNFVWSPNIICASGKFRKNQPFWLDTRSKVENRFAYACKLYSNVELKFTTLFYKFPQDERKLAYIFNNRNKMSMGFENVGH